MKRHLSIALMALCAATISAQDVEFKITGTAPADVKTVYLINKMMAERIDTLQQQLASYEKIKKFTLLPKGRLIPYVVRRRHQIRTKGSAVTDGDASD